MQPDASSAPCRIRPPESGHAWRLPQKKATDRPLRAASARCTTKRPLPRNGGSVRVLSGRACHSALRCRAGISRGRGYRPCTGWISLGEPVGGWPRVSMSGAQLAAGPSLRRNPCGSHGRPPGGPPGTEGTVLICPCAAGRRGLPDGVQLGFMRVQLGGKVIWAGAVAAAGGCRRAVLMWAPRDAAAATPGPGTGRRPGRCLRRFRSSRARAAQPGGTAASPGQRDAGPAGPRSC